MRRAWLLVLAACGASPAPARAPRPARPAPPPPDPHAAIELRARAEEALKKGAPLDYQRPFQTPPWDRTATAALFRDACQAGDKHACIIEAELGAGFERVLANCRAGDLMSCRALPPDEQAPRFPDVPGATSRSVACQKSPLVPPCDAEAVRRECEAGFAAACGELNNLDVLRSEDGRLLQRYPQMLLRGCQAGIASECEMVAQYGTDREQLENSQLLCELQPGDCSALAYIAHAHGDATTERDSFERACQYGGSKVLGLCAGLGASYLDGELVEPVPGRGHALFEFACAKLVNEPACKR
jgi:hypothetical protein